MLTVPETITRGQRSSAGFVITRNRPKVLSLVFYGHYMCRPTVLQEIVIIFHILINVKPVLMIITSAAHKTNISNYSHEPPDILCQLALLFSMLLIRYDLRIH